MHDTTAATIVRIAKTTGGTVGELPGLTTDGDVGQILAPDILLTGGLRLADTGGGLAGTWVIGGDIGMIRQRGTVANWTLRTNSGHQTGLQGLQLGDVRQITLAGKANIGTFAASNVAAGTIQANTLARLICPGEFLAELTLAEEGSGG